jgi:hypothetical protein
MPRTTEDHCMMLPLLAATLRTARLGDSPAQFDRRYGRPSKVTPRPSGVLRQYGCGAQRLDVVFEQDLAVAIFVPHMSAGSLAALLPRDLLPDIDRAAARRATLIGERGWGVTLPGCPKGVLNWLLHTA